jgi:DNA polymerase III subunit delta'
MDIFYPWQQHQWQHLLSRKKSGSFPHALLFTGNAGIGKFDFASLLAKLLLCQNNRGGVSCNECVSCNLIQAKTHPDLLFIQPEEKDKAIKIDQIREMVLALNNTSQQGGQQIAIISPADSMNHAAANALLKTLEEPNSNVIFILVTNKPSLLPKTIVSRCQKVFFNNSDKITAKNWLSGVVTADQNIDLLLSLTTNAPLQALKMINDGEVQQRTIFINKFCDFCAGNTRGVAFAADCSDIDIPIILKYLSSIIYDLLKLKADINTDIINIDIRNKLLALTSKFTNTKLHLLYKDLLQVSRYLDKKVNFNKQLVLENIFLRWF